VYWDADYVNVLGQCARESSMAKVEREVKDLPNYASKGEERERVLVGLFSYVRSLIHVTLVLMNPWTPC